MLSATVAIALFFGWMQIAPVLFPGMFPPPQKAAQNQAANQAPAAAEPDVANVEKDAGATPEENSSEDAPAAAEKLPEFPAQKVILGDAGFEAGFLIKAELNTQGGGLDAVWLTDPRYTTEDRKSQLKVVGNDFVRNVGEGPLPRTLDTTIPEFDELLKPTGKTLATVNWEIVKQDATSVTFRYPSPAGDLEVLKTFSVPKVELKNRDTDVAGYLLNLTVEIRNLTDKKLETRYSLQGPVGVPLEDPENTRIFREIKLGLLENPRNPSKVTSTNMLAGALVKQFDKSLQPNGKAIEDWRAPVHYAGIDDQFFAALILPQGNQLGGNTPAGNPASVIAITRPELLHLDRAKTDRSNMSLVMESPSLKVPAKGSVTNEFNAFFGPKRPQLMQALNAESIIQLGWFAPVAKIMLLILGFFHTSLHLPYALAIIALTVVVRGAMIPVSRKQAIEAEKMKILAPKMKEMQDKYKGQPEEFARAYREFQKKHNYHPMMGCLPALIQLPIFLGLYNSLYHAVDLRLAKFLWIDNLAAPDRLAQLPFTVPYFGWTEFNLLPFITVALFVVQQKLFTPPPTSEEQAMQYKMMNFMMIFIGFAFYRVPAGLCVYFIASSLWGICERLLLKKSIATHQKAMAEAQAEEGAGNGNVIVIPKGTGPAPTDAAAKKAPGWWDKIREAADQAKNTTEAQSSQRKFSKDKGGKGNKPRR
ncbi:membrane protein insertase YidC [Planctomicrobium sp. SH661]|uniref:membrane protein insertase YidC n=1 Tax=Planctomicrobium sp. SH661 TaxID=3448124 RepID=UPI003F5BB637